MIGASDCGRGCTACDGSCRPFLNIQNGAVIMEDDWKPFIYKHLGACLDPLCPQCNDLLTLQTPSSHDHQTR